MFDILMFYELLVWYSPYRIGNGAFNNLIKTFIAYFITTILVVDRAINLKIK